MSVWSDKSEGKCRRGGGEVRRGSRGREWVQKIREERRG